MKILEIEIKIEKEIEKEEHKKVEEEEVYEDYFDYEGTPQEGDFEKTPQDFFDLPFNTNERQLPEDDWACKLCTTKNTYLSIYCEVCQNERDQNEPQIPQNEEHFDFPPNDDQIDAWVCEDCTFRNIAVDVCEICEKARN